MNLGCRVVRGPSWEWGDQDGGEGSLGVVVEIEERIKGTVWVQWETGKRANYRTGFEGKIDLRIYDSSGTGIKHPRIMCDGCNQNPLLGMRWKCLKCSNYDLCTACYMADTHELDCEFARIEEPQGTGTTVGKREGAAKVSARGLFCGARVIQGPDWRWGEQDGGKGNQGTVLALKDHWKDTAEKCGISVRWDSTKIENLYRNGVQGKVDVTAVTPETGGFFYKDHLPGLDARSKKKVQKFNVGDKVLVNDDKNFVMEMQVGHGGWNEKMTTILGMIGTVKAVHNEDGDVVMAIDSNIWLVNPAILTLHEATKSNDDHDDDDERVTIDLSDPLLSQLLSDMLSGGNGSNDDDDDKDNNPQAKALAQAVAHGHLSHVKQILQSHPEVVNHKFRGMTSLHLACHNGHCDIIKLLLETPKCDTTIKDSQGYVAIHHAAYGDKSGEAMKIMLAHGVDPNTADNPNKCSPLHLAVKETNQIAVCALVQHDNCDVNLQDAQGDTPLHDAIQLKTNTIVDLILDASRLNFTLINKQGFNCLQISAIEGNLHAAKKILSKSPELINTAKEDGCTSLHFAAVTGHCDIAQLLLEQADCKVDCLTKNYQTPLMLAIHEGYLTMVQILEEKGADINMTDDDGDTPLHIALMRKKFTSSGMGQMVRLLGNNPDSFTEISKYLIFCGADVRKCNKIGKTPMDYGAGTQVEKDLREVYEQLTKVENEEDQDITEIVNQFGNTNEEPMETDGEEDQNCTSTDNELMNDIPREETIDTAERPENFQNSQSKQENEDQKSDDNGEEDNPGNEEKEFQNGDVNGHPVIIQLMNDIPQEEAIDTAEKPENFQNSQSKQENEHKKSDENGEDSPGNEEKEFQNGDVNGHPVIIQLMNDIPQEKAIDTAEKPENFQNSQSKQENEDKKSDENGEEDSPGNEEKEFQNGDVNGHPVIIQLMNDIPREETIDTAEKPEKFQNNQSKQENEDKKSDDNGEEDSPGNEEKEFQNGDVNGHPVIIQSDSVLRQCLICVDNEANVVFVPCGHCIMCRECSTRAKRCPECKEQVVNKKTKDGTEFEIQNDHEENATMAEKLQVMEKKLRKLEESVTWCVCMSRRMNMVFSCGHGACQVCTEQLGVCAICKKDIER